MLVDLSTRGGARGLSATSAGVCTDLQAAHPVARKRAAHHGSVTTARSFTPVSAPLSTVPQATALFWVIKLLTTGVGETCSDWLARSFDPVIVVAATTVVFAVVLIAQILTPGFRPWRYWLVVTLVGVEGTMVADVAHIGLGIPYSVSTAVLALALAGVFVVWFAVERTLSIHSITTRRRALFYWATVCATFALGTAAGDFTASALDLGYAVSAVLFAAVMVLAAVLYATRRMPAVPAFWIAYVATRPLGASIADGLAVDPARGGLGLGTLPVSIVGLVAIAALVIVATVRHERAA